MLLAKGCSYYVIQNLYDLLTSFNFSFAGKLSTLVRVKYKSSDQIFHLCGLVVEFVPCSVSCYLMWGPLALSLCRYFQYLGLLLERFIRYVSNIFLSLNFTFDRLARKIEYRSFSSRALLLFCRYFQRGFSLLSNLSFLSLILSTEDRMNRKYIRRSSESLSFSVLEEVGKGVRGVAS